ncbi:hypothetical protein SynBIOSE41_02154 [Synechococcus sp. BIOS-E4-1]|nr:hypothetical protein SynBIOSE41_02154 [Synechococcus sp. BIOS-E4-1]
MTSTAASATPEVPTLSDRCFDLQCTRATSTRYWGLVA